MPFKKAIHLGSKVKMQTKPNIKMSEGNNVRIITPGGNHASGNPPAVSTVAGAWILEAPTPLTNELKDSSNSTTQESEENSERKTKKRSGAARRAARKRRLLEAGFSKQVSVANPENNQTPQSEEGFQTPEDTISFKRIKYEAASKVSNEGASKSSTTPKTVTRDIVTSSGEEKVKRSNTEANSHFNYAVIDTERPGGSMSAEQQTKFEAAFSDGLMDLILSSSSDKSVYKIDTARFEKGVFRLAINTVEDVEAIRSMVEGLPELWDNSKLRLVSDEDVPRLQKTHIFIKGKMSVMSTDCILKMLGKQNKELKINLWEVFHRRGTPEGDLIVFGVDPDSFSFLKSAGGRAHLLYSTVQFKVGHRQIASKPAVESCSANVVHSNITTATTPEVSLPAGIAIAPSSKAKNVGYWMSTMSSSGHSGDNDTKLSTALDYDERLTSFREFQDPEFNKKLIKEVRNIEISVLKKQFGEKCRGFKYKRGMVQNTLRDTYKRKIREKSFTSLSSTQRCPF